MGYIYLYHKYSLSDFYGTRVNFWYAMVDKTDMDPAFMELTAPKGDRHIKQIILH